MVEIKAKTYVITGFFGSGKTQFCLNLALKLAAAGGVVTIADLDVINPYFRSREAADQLAKFGIKIVSDNLNNNTGQDLPAVNLSFLTNINAQENVIIDLGGGASGLRLLASCYKTILNKPYEFLCVLNPFRPETATSSQMVNYVKQLNAATPKMPITGLVSNGHMMDETTDWHIQKSQEIVAAAACELGLPLKYIALKNEIVEVKNA